MAKTSQKQKPRRPRGTGSLYQKADGVWVATKELPPDPRTGKRRRLTAKSTRGKSHALAALKEKERRAQLDGQLPATQSPTLAEWADHWVNAIKAPRLRPNTLTMYQGSARRITSIIGAARLTAITPGLLIEWQGKATGRWAFATVQTDWGILKELLRTAVVHGLLPRNPADGVDPPIGETQRREAPTPAEAAAIISTEPDPTWRLQWALAFMGMRQGERHGITLGELETRDGIPGISVRHQLTHPAQGRWPASMRSRVTPVPGFDGYWYAPPKSRAGERWIPLTGALAAIWRAQVEARGPIGDDELLCLRPRDHQPLTQRSEANAWTRALNRCGITRHLVPHSARHTADSILAMLGVPDATRIGIIGHSSTAMDAVYVHAETKAVTDAAVRLGETLAIGE